LVAKLQSGKRGSHTRGALKNREAYLVIFLERYTLLTSHRDELGLQNFPAARLREISCARPRRIQPMLSGGVEVMIGIAQDPLFGPLIAFGLDGIHGEILNDVCFGVTPISDRDAAIAESTIRVMLSPSEVLRINSSKHLGFSASQNQILRWSFL